MIYSGLVLGLRLLSKRTTCQWSLGFHYERFSIGIPHKSLHLDFLIRWFDYEGLLYRTIFIIVQLHRSTPFYNDIRVNKIRMLTSS